MILKLMSGGSIEILFAGEKALRDKIGIDPEINELLAYWNSKSCFTSHNRASKKSVRIKKKLKTLLKKHTSDEIKKIFDKYEKIYRTIGNHARKIDVTKDLELFIKFPKSELDRINLRKEKSLFGGELESWFQTMLVYDIDDLFQDIGIERPLEPETEEEVVWFEKVKCVLDQRSMKNKDLYDNVVGHNNLIVKLSRILISVVRQSSNTYMKQLPPELSSHHAWSVSALGFSNKFFDFIEKEWAWIAERGQCLKPGNLVGEFIQAKFKREVCKSPSSNGTTFCQYSNCVEEEEM